MTTQSWSTSDEHSSDATFRAWGSELAAKMAACGMVQAADTGQVNWATVTRPAVNSLGGYEIWTFGDSLQATAPIYLRVEYRTGAGATNPEIRITVGTGSNGSGTITGTALTASRTITRATAGSATTRQSYMCHTAGFFGFFWKVGGAVGNFYVTRSCDADGVPTVTGAAVMWSITDNGSGNRIQQLRFAATAAAFTEQNSTGVSNCIVPNGVTTSLVGSDNQAYLHWMAIPQVLPIISWCTVIASEVSQGSTFSATLVGSTAHTYIGVGDGSITASGCSLLVEVRGSSTTYRLAMLWE